MDETLHLLSRIQETFSVLGLKCGGKTFLELPQIVVIGIQGSGKSSILESLVGRSFLPRGTGVVTRRPLVVQLVYCSKKDLARVSSEILHPNLEAWGCFTHKPDRRFIKFDEIRKEIQTETCRVAGDKDIRPEPIYLKIYSNSVTLTFVDLPGLAELPVGDQPLDIEQKIRELNLKYISPPNCIIVAVVPANCDIASNECLKLAQKVDPLGNRTVLVISKVDLLEGTSDINDILTGRKIVTSIYTMGVVNRSQREIQQGKTIAQSIHDESSFFKTRYPNLAAKQGIPHLAKSLQYLLLDGIRSYLPQLRSSIASITNYYQNILNECNDPILNKGQTILNVVTSYCSLFTSCIKGNSNDLETSELSGGARISYIFQETFSNTLESIDPLKGYNKIKILTAMRNASGTSPGVFIPEISFELMVKQQIRQLEEPSLQCADLVYQELERVIVNASRKGGANHARFNNLYKRILDISSDMIRLRLPETQIMIRQLIEIQMAYINTTHPDFIKAAMLINKHNQSSTPENVESSCDTKTNDSTFSKVGHFVNNNHRKISFEDPSELPDIVHIFHTQEHSDCLLIGELISCYFDVVRKNIQDYVPKAIMYCLVNYVIENIQPQLVTQLYQPDQFDELLTESKYIIDKRKETIEVVRLLEKATELLNELRDSNTNLCSNRCLW